MRRNLGQQLGSLLVSLELLLGSGTAVAATPTPLSLAYAKDLFHAQALILEYIAANQNTSPLPREQQAFWQGPRGRLLLTAVVYLHTAQEQHHLPLQNLGEAMRFAQAQRTYLARQNKADKVYVSQLATAEKKKATALNWTAELALPKELANTSLTVTSWACPAASTPNTAPQQGEAYACQLRRIWEKGDAKGTEELWQDARLRSVMATHGATTLLFALHALTWERDLDPLGLLFDLQERQSDYRPFYEAAQRIQAMRQRGQSQVLLK